MKYILDFDGVLFNTEALKQKMQQCDILESERGLGVFTKIKEKDPSFEMESLVFPDALEFVRDYGKDCIIVSSSSSIVAEHNTDLDAQKEFQSRKITLSGVGAFIKDIRVVGAEKMEALSKVKEVYGDELVFVDDRESYIREAQELDIQSIWMDREGKGCGVGPEGVPVMLEFVRVGSFVELINSIETCRKKTPE